MSKILTMMNVINIWTSHPDTVGEIAAELFQYHNGIIKCVNELQRVLHN